ncbi:MAG TPA: hypothetical protein VFH99_02350 [Candidatus Saccharimonadales bacterium]|nr:hypothetical protein [Candidatus Saccharimonadales bacterium]
MTSVRFNEPALDGIDNELGGLADKLVTAVNDRAYNRFGKTALRDPSDIEITPAAIDEPVFVVRAWHQTGAAHNAGIVQPQDFTFKLAAMREDMYMSTDDETMYPLTTREAFLLVTVGGLSMLRSVLSSEVDFGDNR